MKKLLFISPRNPFSGRYSGDVIRAKEFVNFFKKKYKTTVVTIDKINSKNKKLNRYIFGKSWNKLISNKETLVVDARKSFEYDVGTFKNSINPNIQNFRDFPKYLKKIDKAKPVGIIAVLPGSILISVIKSAAKSIPEDPFVSYFGRETVLDSLLINISVIY